MIQRIKLWWKGGHAFNIAYFTKNIKLNSCDVVSTWIIYKFWIYIYIYIYISLVVKKV